MNNIVKKLILIAFALCLIALPVSAQPNSGIGGIQSQAELDPTAENFVPTSKAVADYVFNEVVLCSDYDNPDDAITAISSANTTLLVTEAETCDTNFTVPANVCVKFERGGKWTIANGITVTFNGSVEAGLWQIFAYTGTGVLAGNPKVTEVYPEWWGAVGDGSTDDSAEFQDAFDIALTSCGTVYLSAKTYRLDSGLTVTIDTTNRYFNLKGTGGQSEILWMGTGYALTFDGSGTDVTGVILEKFQLNGDSKTADRHGIEMDNVGQNSKLESLTLLSLDRAIYYNSTCVVNMLSNLKIKTCNTGIYLDTVSNSTYISNCGITHCTDYGIYVSTSTNISIINCQLDQNDVGISSYITFPLNIIGCRFESNTTTGVSVTGSDWTYPSKATAIRNCYFTSNGTQAIYLYYALYTTIENNVFTGNTISINGNPNTTSAKHNYEYNNWSDDTTVIDNPKAIISLGKAQFGEIVIIADGDTTPDVTQGTFFITQANTGAIEITDLDNPTVGQTVYLVGGSDTNASTITNSGNFNLTANWTANVDNILVLYVQADNDYIELGRINSDGNIRFANGKGILDETGNEQLIFDKIANAVNYFKITNSITGEDVILEAIGSDSNVSLDIDAKGTGEVNVLSNLNVIPESQYPPAQSDTYVKATTKAGETYWAYYATDPTNSLIDAGGGASWLSLSGADTNQRFHIDLGVAKIVKRIYYENHHHIGGSTTRGAQNYTFWGSNTAGSFAELTYATDTGWTQLTTSQSTFDEHSAVNVADPKYITVTNTTAYRYYAFKFADNYGDADYIAVRRIELQTAGEVTVERLIVGNDIVFEGETEDAFETFIVITEPTADRDITFPDSDETVGVATSGALLLLSTTTVAFNADADTTLYTVPTGKRCVLSHAIVVAAGDAGATTTVSIGQNTAETDFIPANTLSNLDAQYDSVILQPIPNTTPLKIKSYAADVVIEAQVATQSGAAGNTIYLFGILY